MNDLRAKQIFENIQKDGILSEQEIEAINYLIDKRKLIPCRKCSFYVPNHSDSSEFFCSLHKSYLRSNPNENSCTWAVLRENLSEDPLDILKRSVIETYDTYQNFGRQFHDI